MKIDDELPIGSYYVNYFPDGRINVMRVVESLFSRNIYHERYVSYEVLYQNYSNFTSDLTIRPDRHVNGTFLLKLLFETEDQSSSDLS